MKIVSARQMVALDKETIERHGVPGLELMERAGTGIFVETLALLDRLDAPSSVVLFAGRGNNGGDAFVVARLLHGEQVETLTVLVGTKPSELQGDALENHKRLAELDVEIVSVQAAEELESLRERCESAGLVLDGLLGTGLSGEPKGLAADAIRFINSLGLPVVAIDIPSGISGDSGVPVGPDGPSDCYVRADLTVTMALPKLGCFLGKAINAVGRLSIVDIGIPEELVDTARSYGELMTPDRVSHLLPERERLSHKGTYGRLFVLAGSRGYTGAAALAANAAMRAGAGLVFLGIPESLNPILEVKCTEPMTVPLPETHAGTVSDQAYLDVKARLEQCDALIVGPGLSTNEKTALLVRRLLGEATLPVVVDADGLNCLEGRAEVIRASRAPMVITPHPGEMARVTGLKQGRILADPWDAARQTAHNNNVICILKGAHTCIALPSGEVFVNILGNAGMASGGVGDVLTGIIGALLAQGLAPGTAAMLGVTVHALAGDIAADEGDEAGLIASDLVQALPAALRWLRWIRKERPVDGRVTRCYYDGA
jgi:hydroxyethylthiazole kinase-like uncharacterized protein yjeF